MEYYIHYSSTPLVRQLHLLQKKDDTPDIAKQNKYNSFKQFAVPKHFIMMIELINVDVADFAQTLKTKPNLQRNVVS